LSDDEKITQTGKHAAALPLDPVWNYAIQKASEYNCVAEMISLAALATTQQSIFLTPSAVSQVAQISRQQFAYPLSDHITGLNALHAYVGAKLEKKMDMDKVRLLIIILSLY
jgi:pre-mRNA-splicing factor ATP-dependent RNA helicase DHX15/PRP43